MTRIFVTGLLLAMLASPSALASKPGAAQPDGSRRLDRQVSVAAADADARLRWQDAVAHCEGLQAHGHADWRLPSWDEVQLLHAQRKAIGGFPRTPNEAFDQGDVASYLLEQNDTSKFRYWSSKVEDGVALGMDFNEGKPFRLPAIAATDGHAGTLEQMSPSVASVRCVRDNG